MDVRLNSTEKRRAGILAQVLLLGLLAGSTALAEHKVAIYNGSFDPLTRAHETIIQKLLQEFDEVYVVPDRTTQYKPVKPFADRNEMLLQSSRDLEKGVPKGHVIRLLQESDLAERQRKEQRANANATGTEMWDVNNFVMDQYGDRDDVTFYNVVGADTLQWIGTRPEPQKGLQEHPFAKTGKVHLYVINRPFESRGVKYNGFDENLERLFLGSKTLEKAHGKIKLIGQEVSLNRIENLGDVSSTEVRKNIKILRKELSTLLDFPRTISPENYKSALQKLTPNYEKLKAIHDGTLPTTLAARKAAGDLLKLFSKPAIDTVSKMSEDWKVYGTDDDVEMNPTVFRMIHLALAEIQDEVRDPRHRSKPLSYQDLKQLASDGTSSHAQKLAKNILNLLVKKNVTREHVTLEGAEVFYKEFLASDEGRKYTLKASVSAHEAGGSACKGEEPAGAVNTLCKDLGKTLSQ